MEKRRKKMLKIGEFLIQKPQKCFGCDFCRLEIVTNSNNHQIVICRHKDLCQAYDERYSEVKSEDE